MPSRADAADPVAVHRGRVICRICGHSSPLQSQQMSRWLSQAEDFAALHRHPEKMAPQHLDRAEERKTQGVAPDELPHLNPPQAERQAAS